MESHDSQEINSEAPMQEPEDTPPPEFKKSKGSWIIGLAVLIVITVILAIVLVRFLPFVLGGKPSVTELMPADMTAYASVKADLGDLAGFRHLTGIYGDMVEVEELLGELEDDLADTMDITWKDDIQPWLGTEVAVAASGLRTLNESYEQTIYVIMAQTRNKSASDDFIEKVVEYFENEDWDASRGSYEGVDHYVLEPEFGGGLILYLGTVEDFLVLTTDENAMEDVVDTSKGRTDSLEDNQRFNDVMGALPGDAVAYAIMDLEGVMSEAVDEIEQGLAYQGLSLPNEITDLYETYDAYGLALGLHEDGIQLDIVLSFDTDGMDAALLDVFQAEASPNRVLSWIPEDALGFCSGQDLAALWQVAYNLLIATPDAEEQIEDMADELDIRFDEELLNWASGEFAVAVVKSASLEDITAGGFAVVEVDDEEEAQALLEDILGTLGELGAGEIGEDTIDGVEMTLIFDPSVDGAIFGYGFDDGHLIVGFTEDSLEQAVGGASPITGNDRFKAVKNRLPSKVSGYLYANVEEVMGVVLEGMSEYQRKDYAEYSEPFVEPIKAIGLGAEPMDTGTGIAHARLFVYIP